MAFFYKRQHNGPVFDHLTIRFIAQQGAPPGHHSGTTCLQTERRLKLLLLFVSLQGCRVHPVRNGHWSSDVSWSHSEGGAALDLQTYGFDLTF